MNISNPYVVIMVSTTTNSSTMTAELNILPFSTEYDEENNVRKIVFDTERLTHETIDMSTENSSVWINNYEYYDIQPIQISKDGTLLVSRLAGMSNGYGTYGYGIMCKINVKDVKIEKIKIYQHACFFIRPYIRIINNNCVLLRGFVQASNNYTVPNYIIMLDSTLNVCKSSSISVYNCIAVSSDCKYAITRDLSAKSDFTLHAISLDYDQLTATITKIKTFKVDNCNTDFKINSQSINADNQNWGFIIGENNFLIFSYDLQSYPANRGIEIYKFTPEETDILTYVDTITTFNFREGCMIFDDSYAYDGNNGAIYLSKDYSRVIGVKYNGDYYYKGISDVLTAKPEDVVAGKTFIGKQGEQEVGTMEVEQ